MRTLLAATLFALAPAAGAQSFLWEAHSEAGTLYVLGSVHLLRPDAYPLPAAIEKAYEASDVVVFELDLDEMQAGAAQMMQRGLYADGSSLCSHVADSTCALVASRLDALPAVRPFVERAEPWMAALVLTTTMLQQAGYRADLGLDAHFHARAVQDGKPRRALETLEEQIGFMDGLDPHEQEQFLHFTLREMERATTQVDTMTALWKRGDAAGLSALALDDLSDLPGFRSRMLTERNRAWVPPLTALVAEGHTPLVVVGALHLVGEDGLLALLEAQGFTVTQR